MPNGMPWKNAIIYRCKKYNSLTAVSIVLRLVITCKACVIGVRNNVFETSFSCLIGELLFSLFFLLRKRHILYIFPGVFAFINKLMCKFAMQSVLLTKGISLVVI